MYFDSGDSHGSLLLAGSGRSGTTWVENILNHDNSHRVIFEPFHTRKNKLVAHWTPYQYLRQNNQEAKYLIPAKKILDGKVRNAWVNRLNRRVFSRTRIIKEIRANLQLPWLHKNFPEVPIIFLMRHPCAVANSRMQLNWPSSTDVFLSQNELVKDHLAPFVNEIEKITGDFEGHIVNWCIENYIPLKLLKPGDAHITFYEDIIADRSREVQRIFSFLQQPVPRISEKVFNRPSALARDGSAVNQGKSPLLEWQEHVSKEQIQRTLEILRLFGLDYLYNEQPHPLIASGDVLSVE